MSKVSDQIKVRITRLIAEAPQHSIVYDAGGDRTSAGRKGQRGKRDRCLWALAGEIALKQEDVRLVLDSHATEQRADENTLYRAKQVLSLGRFRYDHLPEQNEPLVLIADAAAWCYAKGGLWPGRLGVAAERRDV